MAGWIEEQLSKSEPNMENAKPWYLSKTVWFNVLTLVVGVCDLLAGSPLLGATTLDVVLSVKAAADLGLRFVTNSAVSLFRV